jgi:uncharacterized protein YkwD
MIATFVVAQDAPEEKPSAKSEKTVVIENTGGEWENAKQPKINDAISSVIKQTNEFRKQQKREPVTGNETLMKEAQSFADYMAKTGRYGHTADGETPADRANDAGYEYCTIGENIAYAFRSEGFSTEELAEQFFTGWKQSPPHRRNMLARWVVDTGVGIAKSEDTGTYFAVQVFGRPESAAVTFEVANRSKAAVEYRVEGRSYSVEPAAIRTHKTCNPVSVEFLPLTSKTQVSHPVRPSKTVQAKGGERMTIEATESGYQVTVEKAAATEVEVPPPGDQ